MAQDGSAQVAQAGHGPGSLPEPHVAVSGSVTGGRWLVLQLNRGQNMQTRKGCISLMSKIVWDHIRGSEVLKCEVLNRGYSLNESFF